MTTTRTIFCNSCIGTADNRYNDWQGCINGVHYVACESEYCGGMCEDAGDCDCICHDETDA